MKSAEYYQNKSAEEIARQYRQGLRMKQGLIILAFLLYIVGIVWGVWWADKGASDILLKMVILILVTFPVSIWISWDFMALNLILNQNCDPVTYLGVMRLLGKKRNRKRNALVIRINEAAGLMWSGQFSEALILAESLHAPEKNPVSQISLLNIRFNCHKKLGDREGAMQVRQEAEARVAAFKKPSLQKSGQELLYIMDASLALWQGDYGTFRRMEEARSAGYTAKLQKVVSAVCLANADIAQGEPGNARARLEYAIREGGTLYVVEEARCMLAKLNETGQQ